VDRFVVRENIKHFRDRLWSESNPKTRSRLHQLLLAEENKLAADLELLTEIERHITEGHRRIDRQRTLVASMERDGHDGLETARALLDGLIQSQLLHSEYRNRILITIAQNRA
jgi:hypothetical protein